MIQNPTEMKVELNPWLKNKGSQNDVPIAEFSSTSTQNVIRELNIVTWDVDDKTVRQSRTFYPE